MGVFTPDTVTMLVLPVLPSPLNKSTKEEDVQNLSVVILRHLPKLGLCVPRKVCCSCLFLFRVLNFPEIVGFSHRSLQLRPGGNPAISHLETRNFSNHRIKCYKENFCLFVKLCVF